MIVNISAIRDNTGSLDFKLPKLNFDRRFNYKICVRHINFKPSDPTGLEDNELLCVNTNLVDLSVQNSTQSLLHFPFVARRSIQNNRNPIVTYHALQLYESEYASFVICRFFDNTPVELKFIFLQLEISRTDAYGRVQ